MEASKQLNTLFSADGKICDLKFPPEVMMPLQQIKEVISDLYKEAALFKHSETHHEKVILPYLLKLSKYCEQLESTIVRNERPSIEKEQMDKMMNIEMISKKAQSMADNIDSIVAESNLLKMAMFTLFEEMKLVLPNDALTKCGSFIMPECLNSEVPSIKPSFNFIEEEKDEKSVETEEHDVQSFLAHIHEVTLKIKKLENEIVDCHKINALIISALQDCKMQLTSDFKPSEQEQRQLQEIKGQFNEQACMFNTLTDSVFKDDSGSKHTLFKRENLVCTYSDHIHSVSVSSSFRNIQEKLNCDFSNCGSKICKSEECAKKKLVEKFLHLDFVPGVPRGIPFSHFKCSSEIKPSFISKVCYDASICNREQEKHSIIPVCSSDIHFAFDKGNFCLPSVSFPDQSTTNFKNLPLYNYVSTHEKGKTELTMSSFYDYISSSHENWKSVISQLPLYSVNNPSSYITLSSTFVAKSIDHFYNEKRQHAAEKAYLLSAVEDLRSAKTELEDQVYCLRRQYLEELAKQEEIRKRADFIISIERTLFNQQIITLNEQRDILIKEVTELKNEGSAMADELENIRNILFINKLKEEEKMTEIQHRLETEALKYATALKRTEELENRLQAMTLELTDQENQILGLEIRITDLTSQFEVEKTDQIRELEELYTFLDTRDEECTDLTENLKQCLSDIDELCQENSDLSSRLAQTKNLYEANQAKLVGELNLLKSDNEIMRKKLIRLTKEKDMLWKRTDHLTYFQKSQFAGRWMKDGEVTHCLGCKNRFSFTLRKHHCRLCGKIFCHSCANNWLLTAASRCQTRVCNDCYIQHMQLEKVVKDGSSVHVICDFGEEDELVHSSFLVNDRSDPGVSSVESTLSVGLESNNTSVFDLSSVSNEENLSSADVNIPEKASCGTDVDRNCNFDVITDEEIAKSLSASSPYSPLQLECVYHGNSTDSRLSLTLTRTTTEIEAAGNNGISGEIWISAGMRSGIPILCDSPPVELHWKFVCDTKIVAFNILCKENEDYTEMMKPDTITKSEDSAMFLQSGVYVLQFDNSSSRVKARKVQYVLWIKSAHQAEASV